MSRCIPLLLLTAFTLAAGLAPLPASPAAPVQEVKAVTDANTAFALDLYAKLRTQPGNLFCSPFSISAAGPRSAVNLFKRAMVPGDRTLSSV